MMLKAITERLAPEIALVFLTFGYTFDEISLILATNTFKWEDVKATVTKMTEFPEDMGVEMMIPVLMVGLLIPQVAARLAGTAHLSKGMKARLSYKNPRHGYVHGEKMTTLKAMGAGSTLGMKTTQLVEMRSIIFTPINTKINMLEDLDTKNTDTLIHTFPGVIDCKGSTT